MQQQTKLRNIPDGKTFRLSSRSTAATYEMQSKKKGIATYSSINSNRTFTAPLSTLVYKF